MVQIFYWSQQNLTSHKEKLRNNQLMDRELKRDSQLEDMCLNFSSVTNHGVAIAASAYVQQPLNYIFLVTTLIVNN